MRVEDYHLVEDSGKPFFWLADTAWNLWCRGTPEEWDRYLEARARQGFNVVQFVAGWWRGCTSPVHGQPFMLSDGKLVYDDAAWESLDLLFRKIRDAGMVAAPINLWTLTEIDPGRVLSEAQCIEVARRQVERWDGPDVVWMLGGDGDYTSADADARWKRIGRAVFADHPNAVATLHPCGVSWVGDAFAGEPWYRIVSIQSGHGSQEPDLRFLVDGEYARAWKRTRKPFINLEPNYEDARSYHVRKHLTAYHVRRASYWSLLVAPAAGVTYGIGSIWMWARTHGEIAENHDESWAGRPWHEELDTPGARSMTVLRGIFERLPWTRMRPAPERLLRQPGRDDVEAWQAVAATPEGDCLVAYAPQGGRVELDLTGLRDGLTVYSVNPVSGEWLARGPCGSDPGLFTLKAGTASDALIVVTSDNHR